MDPIEQRGMSPASDTNLILGGPDPDAATSWVLASTKLAPSPTATEPVNNIVKFLRGPGKTAFDWGGVVSNIFRDAAMIVAPMLGSGAELAVLKWNGVLPASVTARDLQMGGVAAQDAGVTSEQMAGWSPEQRGAFLTAGAELVEQRQKDVLADNAYHAALDDLLTRTDTMAAPDGPAPQPGKTPALPEIEETVYIGPPSPRVRDLMAQGYTREEAEKIASNEAVFAGGTGRNAANIEMEDKTGADLSPEQQRLADTLENDLGIPAPLARHIASEGMGFLTRYDQTYLGGYSKLSLEDETGKPIVEYDIVSADDQKMEVVKHPTYDDAANYPPHLGDPDARPPQVGDPDGYAPYDQRRTLTAEDLPEILRANPSIVQIYRGDLNLKTRLDGMKPGDTSVVIRNFGEIHFRDRGEPRDQDVVIRANDDGTWSIRDTQQPGSPEKVYLPGDEISIKLWHRIDGSNTFIYSSDFEYIIQLPHLPGADDGQ